MFVSGSTIVVVLENFSTIGFFLPWHPWLLCAAPEVEGGNPNLKDSILNA